MTRRQHVTSWTARKYYRAGAPESTSRTLASSTPPDRSLGRVFLLFSCLCMFECVEGLPLFLDPFETPLGPYWAFLGGGVWLFGPKNPPKDTGLPLGQSLPILSPI